MMILRIFQNKCLKVLLASHPVWANLTCCRLGVFSDSWPQERKGDRDWGPESLSTAVGPREEFFHFKPVKEPCLSSAGQPGRVRVERGDE